MDAMDGQLGASSSQRHQLSPEGAATRATACFDLDTNIAVPVLRIAEFDLEVLQNDQRFKPMRYRPHLARATHQRDVKIGFFF